MQKLPAWLTSTPIAHRGLYDSAAAIPENSLAAFENAARQGFGCELDVQLSADGQLVVVHDYHLARLTSTDLEVRAATVADLAALRLDGTDQHVPTFAEVLDLVAGRVPLLVETKHRGPLADTGLEGVLAAQIRGYTGELAVQSFDPLAVFRLRRLGVGRPLGQISGRLREADPVSRAISRSMVANFLTRPDFLAYELAGLPSCPVSWWRRRGLPVLAWTVSSPQQQHRADAVADNIIFSGFVPSGAA